MQPKRRITVIGPGRLGTALALALHAAGCEVSEVIGRPGSSGQQRARRLAGKVKARAADLRTASLEAGVLWICVPDAEIAGVAGSLAERGRVRARIALHASGALTSDVLRPLRRLGMAVASVHPLMTFVHAGGARFQGVPFALEGDAVALREARRLVRALGGEAFSISRKKKVEYHAWGAFASPLLVAALAAAEEVAGLAGVGRQAARARMLPIVSQTVANYARLGADRSFSGPIVRGDAATVRAHLQALKKLPHLREVYLALARASLHNLPGKNRAAMRRVLALG